jgi:hypothetical protein
MYSFQASAAHGAVMHRGAWAIIPSGIEFFMGGMTGRFSAWRGKDSYIVIPEK